MKKHKISWLNIPGYSPETWNPIIGCSKVSEGCDNCYAEKMAYRLAMMQAKSITKEKNYTNVVGPLTKKWNGQTYLVKSQLEKPFYWKKPRAIFVCSMGDLFHESVPFNSIDRVFDVIESNVSGFEPIEDHIFIILTKRPERMREYINDRMERGLSYGHSSVWLGVTAENQEQANKRIPILLNIPAAKRFVSIEPMLGAIDFNVSDFEEGIHNALTGSTFCPGMNEPITGSKLDWVICGGESGHKARPMHPDWALSVRDQCEEANVPFFFKQWGKWKNGSFGNAKTVIVLNNGDFAPYASDILTVKYGSNWQNCQATVMNSHNLKPAGDLLDGKQHHNWTNLIS